MGDPDFYGDLAELSCPACGGLGTHKRSCARSTPPPTLDLEDKECELGYTIEQLERMLGDRLPIFERWMAGQTMALCDGRKWNPMSQRMENTDCGPHGIVIYPWDLRRFLAGQPVID